MSEPETPPPDPGPPGPPDDSSGEPPRESDLAVFESRVEDLVASEPVVPRLRAGRITTFTALALLLGIGLLGTAPSAPLAAPKPLDITKDGTPVPVGEEGRHLVSGAGLDLLFAKYDGALAAVRAVGDETGARDVPSLELVPEQEFAQYELRLWDSDDAGDKDVGSPVDVRIDPRGVVHRRRFIDRIVTVDTSLTLGVDEAGEPRRHLDFVLDLHNTGSKTMEVSFELSPFGSLPIGEITADMTPAERQAAQREPFRWWGLAVRETRDGRESTSVGVFDGAIEINDALAVGLMSRYGLRAIVPLDEPGDHQVRRKAEVGLKRVDSGLGGAIEAVGVLTWTTEGIRLEPDGRARRRLRLIFGPKTTWTTAGHGPDVALMTAGSSWIDQWRPVRFSRELMLDFLRGVLGLYASPGLALLLIGLLFALAKRPLDMRIGWSSARMVTLSPAFYRLGLMRREAEENFKSGEERTRIAKITREAEKRLYRDNEISSGLGCLVLLLLLPVFFGLLDAVGSGYALRDASFLWIRDLTKPDDFHRFAEPLFSIPFGRLLPREVPWDLTWRFDAIHLLPITLYALTWVEWLSLRMIGVKRRIGCISPVIGIIFFLLIYYKFDAGVQLVFLMIQLVRMVDTFRLHRYVLNPPAPADDSPTSGAVDTAAS